MHTPTIVVATVALLSSAVVAQERPKFYFPRQVKREISNNSVPLNTPADPSSSTKRDLLGDLLGALTGGAGADSSTSSDSGEVVKTVIVSNTVVVDNGVTTTLPQAPPTTAANTGSAGSTGQPPLGIVLPTISLDLPSLLSPILSPSSSSSADGIAFGPSGILGSGGILPSILPTGTGSAAQPTDSGLTYSGSGTAVSSSTDGPPIYNTLGPSGGIISSILGGLDPSATGTGTGTSTGTGAPTGTGNVGTGSATTFPPTSTGTASASSTGLDSMISSIISTGGSFPTVIGSNSTTHRIPPIQTSDSSSHYRNNGTAIVLPPTTSTKGHFTPTDTPTSLVPSITSDWVGSSILVQTTPTGTVEVSTTSIPSGIPSSLPQVVAPVSGVPTAPVGFTLIQVGFKYPLNYEFVVSNSMSSAQIFTYLPKGIAYGLEVEESSVIMHSLQPFDTSTSLGFITTLALAYIPDKVVSNLGIMIHVPVSRLYNNPSEPVDIIMKNINPAIQITVGSGLDGSGDATSVGGGSSSSTPGNGKGNGQGGIFDTNNDSNQSSPGAKGMTAGIATGAVVAAAAYGAAMFFIARRYKKRKLAHRRSRSLMNPAEMVHNEGSPALMGGAYMSGGRQSTGSGSGGSGSSGSGSGDRHSRGSGKSAGNSARTAQISGPMMAENSLGWN